MTVREDTSISISIYSKRQNESNTKDFGHMKIILSDHVTDLPEDLVA